MLLTIPFMVANFFGFRSNLLFQATNHDFLETAISPDDPSRPIVVSMKPFNYRVFVVGYILICSFVLGFGWYFSDQGLQGIASQFNLGSQAMPVDDQRV